MKAIAAIALAAVCLPIIGQAPAAHLRHSGKWALPDRHATPGAVNPAVIADVTKAQKRVDGIEVNLCAPDFSASRIRATIRNFAGLKRKACAEYGVKRCDKSVEGDENAAKLNACQLTSADQTTELKATQNQLEAMTAERDDYKKAVKGTFWQKLGKSAKCLGLSAVGSALGAAADKQSPALGAGIGAVAGSVTCQLWR